MSWLPLESAPKDTPVILLDRHEEVENSVFDTDQDDWVLQRLKTRDLVAWMPFPPIPSFAIRARD